MMRIACLLVLLCLPFPPVLADTVLHDNTGRKIAISVSEPRVVTLAPHLAELVFVIGAGEQLVGTVEWSNFPEAAKEVPRVGDAFRIDFEQVLGLQPDLILAWGGGTPTGVIDRLRELGQEVAVLEPTTLESIAGHVEWLGKALGHEKAAAREVAKFRNGVAELRNEFSGRREISVFYQISSQPLFTVNGRHPISELIRLCGGRNVFAGLETLSPAVTLEAVLGRDPQVIVAGQYSREDGSLDRWEQWQDLAAVRHGNLLTIDAEKAARATPRMLEAGSELCEAMEGARERIYQGVR